MALHFAMANYGSLYANVGRGRLPSSRRCIAIVAITMVSIFGAVLSFMSQLSSQENVLEMTRTWDYGQMGLGLNYRNIASYSSKLCGIVACSNEGCDSNSFFVCMTATPTQRKAMLQQRYPSLDLITGELGDLPEDPDNLEGELGNLPVSTVAADCGAGACDPVNGCSDESFFACMMHGLRATKSSLRMRFQYLAARPSLLSRDLAKFAPYARSQMLAAPDQGELSGLPAEANLITGELGGLPADPDLVNGELGNLPAEKNLIDGELGDLPSEENLTEGELSGLPADPNLIQGELSGLPAEKNLMEGELSGLPADPNLLEGELGSVAHEPNLLVGELGTVPDEPNLLIGELGALAESAQWRRAMLEATPQLSAPGRGSLRRMHQ